jgi:phage shock protein E
MIRQCSLFVFVALFVLSPYGQAAEHTKDSLDDIKSRLNNKQAVLIDVREESEWKAGHLKQATLLPLSKLREGANAAELGKQLDKGKIIYCHCASGRRVLVAADILKELGYDIRPLKQGFADLRSAGFPAANE